MYEKDPVKIFVVEDDPAYTKFLKYVLGLNPDYEVDYYTTGKDCLANLYKNPTVVTLDYSLPDMPGEKVLNQIRAQDPNINVIIVSAQEKIHTAVELLKSGAYDYISKDHETKERLLNSINNARNKTSSIFTTGCLDSPPYIITFPHKTSALDPYVDLSTGRSISLVHPPFPAVHPTEGTRWTPPAGAEL